MGHDVGSPGDRRERKAAADHFAERAQIGHHTVIFLRAAIRKTEPGHYLVKNQRNAVLCCDLAQSFEKAGHRRDNTLEGFEDNGRELVSMLAHHGCGRLYVVERGYQNFLAHAARDAR